MTPVPGSLQLSQTLFTIMVRHPYDNSGLTSPRRTSKKALATGQPQHNVASLVDLPYPSLIFLRHSNGLQHQYPFHRLPA